jgi:ketosteroid isomerase-like protein
MNRLFLCSFSLLLVCCAGFAQNPGSGPDSAQGAATTPAVPTVTSTQPTEVTQFQKIEDSWSDSVNRRDQYGLELVLSPLFVDVSASGDVTTRNQQVAQLINGADKTADLTQKVITVRMLGDVAVANGTYLLHHKVNSQEVDEKGVFTHVYQRVRGGWLCVNSQRTVLRTDAGGKAKEKKETTAEEPFHIPFFSKGDKNGSDKDDQ